MSDLSAKACTACGLVIRQGTQWLLRWGSRCLLSLDATTAEGSQIPTPNRSPLGPPLDAVGTWRTRVLDGLIWAYLGLGSLAAVAGVVVAALERAWIIVVLDCLAWLLALGLALCPSRFYRAKAVGILAISYLVGLYFTYRFGPFAAGPYWLFAGPMIAGALLGWRAALGSLGLLAATLAGIGLLLVRGGIVWPGDISLGLWVVISSSLLALSGIISIAVGVLLGGVEQANRAREDAIAARQQLEQRLRHSQKMEAVGRLAGGIAHDFNNLLVAVLGFTELAMQSLEGHPDVLADLSEVTAAVHRGKSLTGQLLSFTRTDVLAPRVIDLNDAIKNSDRLLEQLSGSGVEVHLRLCPTPCHAKIDPDAFSRILVNATLNARDAMASHGKLTLNTTHVAVVRGGLDAAELEIEPGAYVRVSIGDTGQGISPDHLEKIFEPFFTTKPVGEGTGLGLSTCWAIATQAGGSLRMRSELGHGTTLELYLPSSSSPHEELHPEPSAKPVHGEETILVVDDDEAVRTTFTRTLKTHGYRVFEAGNAEEAIALLGRTQARIDLLVTDVIMPGMSGRELADHVEMIQPGISILYVSGFSGELLSKRGELDGDVAILKKPFSLEMLSSRIRQLLDSRG